MGCRESLIRRRRARRSGSGTSLHDPKPKKVQVSKSVWKKQKKAKAKLAKALAEAKTNGDAELREIAMDIAGLGGAQQSPISGKQTANPDPTPKESPIPTPEQTPERTPEQTTVADVHALAIEPASPQDIQKEETEEDKSPREKITPGTSDDAPGATRIDDAVAAVTAEDDAENKTEDPEAILEQTQSAEAKEGPTGSASVSPKLIVVNESDICVDNTLEEPAITTAAQDTETLIKEPAIANAKTSDIEQAPLSVQDDDQESKEEEDKDAEEIPASTIQEDGPPSGSDDECTQSRLILVAEAQAETAVDNTPSSGADEPRAQDATSSLDEAATDLVESVLAKVGTEQDASPLPDKDQGQGVEPRALDSTSSLDEAATNLVESVLAKVETEQDASPLPDKDQGQGVEPRAQDSTSSLDEAATNLVQSVLAKVETETEQDASPLPDKDQGQGAKPKDDTASTDDETKNVAADQAAIMIRQEAASLVESVLTGLEREDPEEQLGSSIQARARTPLSVEPVKDLKNQAGIIVSDVVAMVLAAKEQQPSLTDCQTEEPAPAIMTSDMAVGTSEDMPVSTCSLDQQDDTAAAAAAAAASGAKDLLPCAVHRQISRMVEDLIASLATEDQLEALSEAQAALSDAYSSVASVGKVELSGILSSSSSVRPVGEVASQTRDMCTQTKDLSETISDDGPVPAKKPSTVCKIKTAIRIASKRSLTALLPGKKDKATGAQEGKPATGRGPTGSSKTKLPRQGQKAGATTIKASVISGGQKPPTRDLKTTSGVPSGASAKPSSAAKPPAGKKTKASGKQRGKAATGKKPAASSASSRPPASKTRGRSNLAEKLKGSRSSSFPRQTPPPKPSIASAGAANKTAEQGSGTQTPGNKQLAKPTEQKKTAKSSKASSSSSSRKLKPSRVSFRIPQDVASSPGLGRRRGKSNRVHPLGSADPTTDLVAASTSAVNDPRASSSGKSQRRGEASSRRANSACPPHGAVGRLADQARPVTVMAVASAAGLDPIVVDIPDSGESAMGDNVDVTRENSVAHLPSVETQETDRASPSGGSRGAGSPGPGPAPGGAAKEPTKARSQPPVDDEDHLIRDAVTALGKRRFSRSPAVSPATTPIRSADGASSPHLDTVGQLPGTSYNKRQQ